MTSMHDVAEPACCPFCNGNRLEWFERGWADCLDCTASLKYSRRLGRITEHNPPNSMQAVSDLLHRLRQGA